MAAAEQSYSYYSRYNGTDRVNLVSLTFMRGPIMDEVHQQLNSWLYQITRVYKGKEHAEVEFNIGPIPVHDGVGKEITIISTAMKTNKTFYMDSNGRDFIKRINLGIYVEDESRELSVLVDRAVGGSSLEAAS